MTTLLRFSRSMFSGIKPSFPALWRRVRQLIPIVALLAPTTAFSGVWQNYSAPWTDDYFLSLAVVPGEGIYAGGAGRLHVSRDDGATWTPVATPTGYIAMVVNARTRPETLYATNVTEWDSFAGNRIEVLQSLDAGRNWTSLASGTRCYWLALNSGGVPAYCFDIGYVTTFYPALFHSGDAGRTWQAVNFDTLHPSVTAVVFAGGTTHVASERVQYSTNEGRSWHTSPSTPPGATSQIIVEPGGPSTVYVGSTDGLYKSQDAGRTWAHLAFSFPITALAIDPYDGALYAGFQGGIARSRDGGITWQSVSNGLTDQYIGLIEFADDKLYAVSSAGLSVCSGKGCTDLLQPLADNVVEFYHAGLDHFFYTSNAGEQAWLDAGGAGGGWTRTGFDFRNGGSERVCRFYGSVDPGPNSHFYTVVSSECEGLKELQALTPDTEKRWNYEGNDFFSTPPSGEDGRQCPAGTVPVYRAYNNGFALGIDSNHRLTTSEQKIQEVVARGWIAEGVMMCARQ